MILAPLAPLDLPELPDHRVFRVKLVPPVRRGPPVQKVSRGSKDPRDLLGPKAPRDPESLLAAQPVKCLRRQVEPTMTHNG